MRCVTILDKKKLKTTNPATGEVINEYEIMSKEQIEEITKRAKTTFHEWKKDPSKRADYLYHVADIFRKERKDLQKL